MTGGLQRQAVKHRRRYQLHEDPAPLMLDRPTAGVGHMVMSTAELGNKNDCAGEGQ
jgi:hypothetical protein